MTVPFDQLNSYSFLGEERLSEGLAFTIVLSRGDWICGLRLIIACVSPEQRQWTSQIMEEERMKWGKGWSCLSSDLWLLPLGHHCWTGSSKRLGRRNELAMWVLGTTSVLLIWNTNLCSPLSAGCFLGIQELRWAHSSVQLKHCHYLVLTDQRSRHFLSSVKRNLKRISWPNFLNNRKIIQTTQSAMRHLIVPQWHFGTKWHSL